MLYRPCYTGYCYTGAHHRFCSHHRANTNSDQGRDHEVSPATNRFHTSRTEPGLIEVRSQLLFSRVLSTTGLISPRSHCSKGNVKPRFGRFTIPLGNSTPRLASNNPLGTFPRNFSTPGVLKQTSTSVRSRKGTRNSRPCAMLMKSESRSRVLRM